MSPNRIMGVAVAVAGVVGAWFAASDAIGNVARTGNPRLAAQVSPNDGRVVANLAQAEILAAIANKKTIAWAGYERDARRALRLDPLNSIALRTLGWSAEDQKQIKTATKFVELSQRISRRDGLTQFWLIIQAARERDVKAIVRHCDILLRTQTAAGAQLAPILNQALPDPAFRREMLPHIRGKSPWIPDYLNYAANNAQRPDALSQMIRAAGGVPDSPVRRETESTLLRRLVETGAASEILRFFPLMKGARGNVVNSFAFTPATTDPRFAPVTWEALSPNAIVASFDEEKNGALSLNVVASAGERGVVARKLLALRPGTYRFETNVSLADAGDRYPFAAWKMRCVNASAKPPFWQSRGNWPVVGKHAIVGPAIPASCPLQFLELEVAGGLAGEGIELTIPSVRLRPTVTATAPSGSET